VVVVSALNDRCGAVKTALVVELKNVQENVTAQIVEYNRLQVGVPATAKLSSIPRFADGGIVTKPTIPLVGQRGPEMIVPFAGTYAGGGINITIHLDVINKDADSQAVMAMLAREIQKQVQRAA
jgi:hypothetical protein